MPPLAFSFSYPPLTLFLQGAGAFDALRCLSLKAVNNQQNISGAGFEFGSSLASLQALQVFHTTHPL